MAHTMLEQLALILFITRRLESGSWYPAEVACEKLIIPLFSVLYDPGILSFCTVPIVVSTALRGYKQR